MPSGRPPCSNACFYGRVLDELRQAPEDGRVCVWHDSMPKVEYMTRPSSGTFKDNSGLGLDPLPRAEQGRRVEVALHAAIVADELPAAVERHAPVEPDHVAPSIGHRRQQVRRARAEMDRWDVDG